MLSVQVKKNIVYVASTKHSDPDHLGCKSHSRQPKRTATHTHDAANPSLNGPNGLRMTHGYVGYMDTLSEFE